MHQYQIVQCVLLILGHSVMAQFCHLDIQLKDSSYRATMKEEQSPQNCQRKSMQSDLNGVYKKAGQIENWASHPRASILNRIKTTGI